MSLRVLVRLKPSTAEAVVARKVSHCSVLVENPVDPSNGVTYQFDEVFSAATTTSELFATLRHKVERTADGINVSIIAHGATGSGKTHTLYGQEDPGLALLTVRLLSELSSKKNCTLHLSATEIYNEKVCDLLSQDGQELTLYDTGTSVTAKGLKEIELLSEDHFQSHVMPAIQRRHTAATKLNAKSSRGHVLLIIKVVSRQQKTTGKLVIADLAGSENNSLTGNRGNRMRESQKINGSLFAFSLVLDAINHRQKAIPYRNSKLTRLLKDSIGGSSLSTIIATIDPSRQHYQATQQTLLFSCKATKVVNEVVAHTATPCRLPPKNIADTSTDTAETPCLTPSPKRPAYEHTPSRNKLPLGFSPFVRTVVGRLQRIEDKLEEQSVLLNDVTTIDSRQTTLTVSPTKPLSISPEPLFVRMLQPSIETSVRNPVFSIPFLAEKKSNFRPLKRQRPALNPTVYSQVQCMPTSHHSFSFEGTLQDQQQDGLLLLNKGTCQQLCKLPGVGKKRAMSIIAQRERTTFRKIQDLANIPLFPSSVINHLLGTSLK